MSPADTSNAAPYFVFCRDRCGNIVFWAFETNQRPVVFVLPETEWNEWVNLHDFAFRNTLFEAGYSSRGCWCRPSVRMIEALREGCDLLHPRDLVLVRMEDGDPIGIRTRVSTLKG